MPKSHPDKDRAMPVSPSVLDDAVPGHDQPGGAQDPALAARPGKEGSMPQLGAVSAVIEDGLLMVFGPDGDPVPPEIFCAAADDQPEALVRLRDDEQVPAARISTVLEAQTAGRLVPGEGEGSGWIAAMLGLGPQPAPAFPDELEAEERSSLPVDLPAPLPPPPPEQAGDRDEEPVPAVVIVAGLPEGAVLSAGADNGDGSWSIPVEDVPGLALTLPPGQASALRLTVSVVSIAGRDGALAVRAHQIIAKPGEPLRLDLPAGTAPPAAMRSLPLGISGLVEELAEGGRIDAVALSGLPDGLALSAGVHDQRTGCWIVRPEQLAGLEVRAAHGASSRVVLRLTAMTIDRTSGKPSARSRRLRIDLDSLAPRMAQDPPVRAGGVGFFRPLCSRRRLA